MNDAAHVGPVARLLGCAGLLPQAALVVTLAQGLPQAVLLCAVYALAILSFLGGIWWGMAMYQQSHQTLIAGLAVLPSLLAVGFALALGMSHGSGWVLVAIGVAILLTLPVDRWLTTVGIAPIGWMALRVPLSVGLGGLTIAAGAVAGG